MAKRGQSDAVSLHRPAASPSHAREPGRERRSSARNESSRGRLIGPRKAEKAVSRWL
jgi:hypothetical protein